ncbi:MAG: hypothetical protein EOO15_19470 [Chitinophagaceae bacterium]|nr:MAG: hypothetical protein EOO15_19470 [Chitinophagaceae bacterium]
MTYPDFLSPSAYEPFPVDGLIVSVPKSIVSFKKWQGEKIRNDFGGKPLIDYFGRPLFAELAIMRTFLDDGWQTRWVETYGTKEPKCMVAWKDDEYKDQEHSPFEDEAIGFLFSEIASKNGGSYSGCWDVVAKKDNNIIFAESKRSKKDAIRESQQKWFRAALQCGLSQDNFLMVQWDFAS